MRLRIRDSNGVVVSEFSVAGHEFVLAGVYHHIWYCADAC